MKLNDRQHRVYDIIISFLAVCSMILIFIDYNDGLNGWRLLLNRGLLVVFTADYLTRLQAAPDKGVFFRTNIFDLVALIPFHGIFMPAANIMVDDVLRLCNLLKSLAFLVRPLKKASLFFNTNGFKYVIMATVAMILCGGVLIHYAEGMTLSDGVWWAFVTATTVGYGDISPHTFYGRIIAMVLMLVGIGLLGSVTSTLTAFFMGRRNASVKNDTLEMIQSRLERYDELTDEDIDQICSLLKAMKKKKKR
ncbi:MAG: potassium channel family protein [Blautia sp.]|nr:potassium channel family protein [Blautia sp.]